MRILLLFVVSFLFCGFTARGQSVQEIEDKVYAYLQAIEKWDSSNENNYDSLIKANKSLLDYLNETLPINKATLKYSFEKLRATRMNILSSDDNKFRVYSWYLFGSMGVRSFNVLAQYEVSNGSKVKIINDDSKADEFDVCSGGSYSQLYTIHTKKAGNVYLTISAAKYAMGLYGESMDAYAIDKDRLNDTFKLFKTVNKALSSISCVYDFALDANKKIRQASIKVSSDKRTIYVPLINKNDEITVKFLIYKFDGNYFVFDKNAK